MIFILTEEEEKWVVKEFLNWHIKKGCPKEIKEKLQRKLDLLRKRSD